jgi:hypothetical protein
VTQNGDRRGAYRVLVGRHEGRRPLYDLGVNGRISNTIFKKRDEEYGLD